MKKIVSLISCLCILITLLGCQTEKQVTPPKQIVMDYLQYLQNGNLKKAAAISGEIYHENEFGDSSYDSKDLKQLMFGNLQFSIKSEKFDKANERATVNLEISNTNYLQLLQEAMHFVTNDPQTNTLPDDKKNQAVMKKAKQLYKDNEAITQRVTVLFEKQNNGKFQMVGDNAPFHLAITGQGAHIEN